MASRFIERGSEVGHAAFPLREILNVVIDRRDKPLARSTAFHSGPNSAPKVETISAAGQDVTSLCCSPDLLLDDRLWETR